MGGGVGVHRDQRVLDVPGVSVTFQLSRDAGNLEGSVSVSGPVEGEKGASVL